MFIAEILYKSRVGPQKRQHGAAGYFVNGLALSVTAYAVPPPPKWEALAVHAKFAVLPRALPLIDSPVWGRWHKVPEGEQAGREAA